jgi:NAD(P)H-dependent flavin oxidoreductase YrpB (nitropropane dioxygenase family)
MISSVDDLPYSSGRRQFILMQKPEPRMAALLASAAHFPGRPGSARAALDLGADYLVCQGTEAGGHVQANSRLLETLF